MASFENSVRFVVQRGMRRGTCLKSALGIVAVAALSGCASGGAEKRGVQEAAQPGAEQRERDQVAAEVAARARKSQQMVREKKRSGKPYTEESKKRLTEINRDNTEWLRQILGRHGWLKRSEFGEEAAGWAWVIVHYSEDTEFLEYCLTLMEPLLVEDEVDAREYALLLDRVRVRRGRPQVYGTQFQYTGDLLRPCPIEDAANVDARRQEMGLLSLEQYAQQLQKTYRTEVELEPLASCAKVDMIEGDE